MSKCVKVVDKVITRFNLSDPSFMAFSETLFYFVFLRQCHHVAQAGLELTSLQFQPTKYRIGGICHLTPI